MLYKSFEPFTIGLDDIAYWLETVKGNLKATLIESYSKIADYKIIISASLVPNNKQKYTVVKIKK